MYCEDGGKEVLSQGTQRLRKDSHKRCNLSCDLKGEKKEKERQLERESVSRW